MKDWQFCFLLMPIWLHLAIVADHPVSTPGFFFIAGFCCIAGSLCVVKDRQKPRNRHE